MSISSPTVAIVMCRRRDTRVQSWLPSGIVGKKVLVAEVCSKVVGAEMLAQHVEALAFSIQVEADGLRVDGQAANLPGDVIGQWIGQMPIAPGMQANVVVNDDALQWVAL